MLKIVFEQIDETDRTKPCTSLLCSAPCSDDATAHFRGIIEDGSEAFLCRICMASYAHITIHKYAISYNNTLKRITLEIEGE